MKTVDPLIPRAREALKTVEFKGVSVFIPDDAKVDSRNDCGFYVEAYAKPTKKVKPCKLAVLVDETLRGTTFPRNSYGEPWVDVNVLSRRSPGKQGVPVEVWVMYGTRVISGAQTVVSR